MSICSQFFFSMSTSFVLINVIFQPVIKIPRFKTYVVRLVLEASLISPQTLAIHEINIRHTCSQLSSGKSRHYFIPLRSTSHVVNSHY